MKKMIEPAVAPIADEELTAVAGASGLPYFDMSSLSVLASPVTVTQVNVNTPTQVATGIFGGSLSQSSNSAQGNSSVISYGK